MFVRHRTAGGADPEGIMAKVIIVRLAFSSSGQVAIVRSLQITDIPTANATSAYVDTFIDVDLYKLHNRSRTRRFLFLVSLCASSRRSICLQEILIFSDSFDLCAGKDGSHDCILFVIRRLW